MLALFLRSEIRDKYRESIRDEIKERTGEDCLILGPEFTDIKEIHVKADNAAPVGEAAPEDHMPNVPDSIADANEPSS